MTLKKLASEIERKKNQIETLKSFISINAVSMDSEFRSMLQKRIEEKKALQVQFDNQYELCN